MSETAAAPSGDVVTKAPKRKKLGWKQVVTFVLGLIIVVGIFAFAIPRFADYGDVWKAMKTLTPLELWSLIGATVFNLYTYWLANQAGLIGLTIGKSAVTTQTSTSVANTLPAGGAIAIGVTFAQLGSWGFTPSETTLFVGVTGIWNIFTKLGLPVIALALLVITGYTSAGLVIGAAVGIVVLAIAVGLLVLVFRSESGARKVGDLLGRFATAILKPFRKGPVENMGDRSVKFRRETLILVRRRWFRLTWTTVLSHIALFFVLLLSLRHMGVSEEDIPTVEVFGVFAFSRLLSAVPITPGAAGVIDLGYIGGLTALDSSQKPEIVAAVLLFRVLTYGIQIPIGGFTYLYWRWKKSWFRDTPPPGSISEELARAQTDTPAAAPAS